MFLDSSANIVKFIYSEKATKFCEIFSLLLTAVHTVKRKGKISQTFVAFSAKMNFKTFDSCLTLGNFTFEVCRFGLVF